MRNRINNVRVLQLVFLLVIIIIGANVVYLSVTGVHFISQKNIREYAEGTAVSTKTIYASRGNIYSSDSEILASDVVSYKLTAYLSDTRLDIGNVPAYVTDPKMYSEQLAPILNMPENDLYELLTSPDLYLVEFGTYGNDLSPAKKNQIDALGLAGLEFTAQTKRNYRYGNFASYILGYATNSAEDSAVIEGVMGLEAILDEHLAGRNGSIQYLTDSLGYNLPNGLTQQVDAKDGNDVYLTINSNIQRDMQLALEEFNGTSVTQGWTAVMEAKTGRILAIATIPSFDPNTKEISNYNDLFLNNPYEVGSVMKPFVYLTAYDQGVDLSERFLSGGFDVGDGGSGIYDWNKVGWGSITYDEGLIRSSNTAITYLLSQKISLETLQEKYYKLGFFQEKSISGLYSGAGVNNMNESNRDYYSSGFGQSSSWTAIDLLKAYSVFANNGSTVEPYVVDKIVDGETGAVVEKYEPQISEQVFSSEAIAHVSPLLSEVINNFALGSGISYSMTDVHVMGKTGTAELLENGSYSYSRYTYSIATLAPYEDPEYLVVSSIQCDSGDTKAQYTVLPNLVKTLIRSAMSNVNQQTTTGTHTNIEYDLNNFKNQSVSFAKGQLESNGIQAIVLGNGNTVIKQNPDANTKISSNSKVFLLSDGEQITMPNMEGWSRKDVSSFCLLANISVEYHGTGHVVKQSIAEGEIINNESVLVIETS